MVDRRVRSKALRSLSATIAPRGFPSDREVVCHEKNRRQKSGISFAYTSRHFTSQPITSIFSSGKAAAASLKSVMTSSTLETSALMATALPPLSMMDFTTYNDMDVTTSPNICFKERKRRRGRRRKYVRSRQQTWRVVLLCCRPLCQLHEPARVANTVVHI